MLGNSGGGAWLYRMLFAVILVLTAAGGSASPCLAQSPPPIRIVTEEFPPYDFSGADGLVEGLSTDVVRAALEEVGASAEIKILPWARAYKLASREPNVMLYSVVRTADREPLFHWVGVVCEVRSFLYKLKKRDDISSNDLADLKDYAVGVVRGWAGQRYLEKNGFHKLQTVAVSEFNIRKLIGGRVDLIEDYEANIVYRMKRMGLDYGLLEKVYFNADISGPLFAVFNRDTPEDVVGSFRKAFSKIHLDGRYDAIRKRWLKPE